MDSILQAIYQSESRVRDAYETIHRDVRQSKRIRMDANIEVDRVYRLMEKKVEEQEQTEMIKHDIPANLQARRLLVWYHSVYH